MSYVYFDIKPQKKFARTKNSAFSLIGLWFDYVLAYSRKVDWSRFEAKTSLLPAAKFLIESVQRYPCEPCQICRQVLILTSSLQYRIPFLSIYLLYQILVFIPSFKLFFFHIITTASIIPHSYRIYYISKSAIIYY